MKRKIIIGILLCLSFSTIIPGCSRGNPQQSTEQSEEDKKTEELKKQCKEAVNNAYTGFSSGGYHFMSYIGDNGMLFDFGLTEDRKYVYLDARYAELPIMYYDTEADTVYYSADIDSPWYYLPAEKALYLKSYILQKQTEFLTNYLDYANESSFVIKNSTLNGENCYELSFSYDGTKLFSDQNNGLQVENAGVTPNDDTNVKSRKEENSETESSSKGNPYTGCYYVRKSDMAAIAVENNIGEIYSLNMDPIEISEELQNAVPGSSDFMNAENSLGES